MNNQNAGFSHFLGPLGISLFHQKYGSGIVRIEQTNKQTTKQIHRQINK